ncbi:MgtC/SapB family protein [Paenibacillus sp. IB182496]|uniref:MgtC/SapB family protein n=2 Tax=Paenibacillus sabuli TaxID=2772509 RepID=A0A927BT71_9BACL|nr:MgtC/SapB family protein [Paenibacillus sabuli]MBD2846341.1 MgtC/SapB family protein [Paenibacillus sabuli]
MDTGSVWEISWADLTIRMVLAAVLGGMIGFEREWSNHAAGFRTHILVCLGSATIMLMSIYGFGQFTSEASVRMDPARLAAQVISGIGFLGAGAILRNGSVIKGLTTAASIWTVAAIGLCVGAGFYTGALLCTLMVLISLYALNKWEKVLLRHRRYQSIALRVEDRPDVWRQIVAVLESHRIHVTQVTLVPDDTAGRSRIFGLDAGAEEGAEARGATLNFKLKSARPHSFLEAAEALGRMKGVYALKSDSLVQAAKKVEKS